MAIISSYGACALIGIGPFAVYRFATGNLLAAALDLGIVVLICLAVAHSWRGGRREQSTLVLAIVNTVGCLASATVLGPPGLFWMYPALLGNFLLLDRGRVAAEGTPAEVLTRDIIERVYKWPVAVTEHGGPGPDAGAPQVVPLRPS